MSDCSEYIESKFWLGILLLLSNVAWGILWAWNKQPRDAARVSGEGKEKPE